MLSDRLEFPCQTIDVSPIGVAVKAHVVADVGERVVAYFEELGRIEGVTVRRGESWFAIDARTSPARIDRLAQKIAALSGGSAEDLVVAKTAETIRTATLRTEFGQDFPVQLAEESSVRARVLADIRLLPGAKVTIDKRPAVVELHCSDGFLVMFSRPSV